MPMSSNPGLTRRSVCCARQDYLNMTHWACYLTNFPCLFFHAPSSAQTSQHPDAPPASGPAQPLHRGAAAPRCLRTDSVLPPDVSSHTSQPRSAGETPACWNVQYENWKVACFFSITLNVSHSIVVVNSFKHIPHDHQYVSQHVSQHVC